MRVCLQDDPLLDGIHLQETRSDQICVYSGDLIREGTHAVSLQNRNYYAWLSIEAVDDLIRELRRFDPDDPSGNLTPYGHTDVTVSYYEEANGCSECPACDDRVGYHVPAFLFQNPRDKTQSVYVHRDCAKGVCEALERVWEHGDKLLPELI